MPSTRLLFVAASLALGLGACGGGGRIPFTPPLIKVSLTFAPPLPAVLRTGDVYEATVTLTNPDLHHLTVTLLNPPPGCFFEAGRAVPHGDARRLRWNVPAEAVGAQRLVFFAAGHVEAGPNPSDELHRERTVLLDTRVEVGTRRLDSAEPLRTLMVGDVTGDGSLDAVAVVPQADLGTGTDVGVVLVWFGASLPNGLPSAELRAPSPQPGDQLGGGAGVTLQLADVTGDGVLDVLVGSPSRDVGGLQDVGSVLVWKGGAIVGNAPPLAELRRPAPRAGDGAQLRFKVADVTGDDIRDVLINLPMADTSVDDPDVGAVLVAAGGPSLAAAVELLHPFTSQAGVKLGLEGDAEGLVVADVTGDGKAEMMLPAPRAAMFGGLEGAGCVLLWRHTVTTAGVPSFGNPRQLIPAEIAEDTALGGGIGVRVGDVTGDGLPDIVSGSSRFGNATLEMGQAAVWAGGSALFAGAGQLVATATMRVANILFDAHLCEGPGGLQLGDVTGDGVLDVLASAPLENGSQGAIYMWRGGPDLVEFQLPTLRLADPNGLPGHGLAGTLGLPSPAFHLVDVTGDGVKDVLSAAPHVGVSRFTDVGAIHLWAGGATLSSAPSATLTLSTTSSGAQLGSSRFANGAAGIQLMDLTGDGLPEILGLAAGAPHADVGGAGVIGIWNAGPALAGLRTEDALLVDPTPLTDGHLGSQGGDHPLLCDLTGDHVPELVASSQSADAARMLVWSPGTAPAGTISPVVSFTVDSVARLPHAVVGDLDADGLADVAFVERTPLISPTRSVLRVLPGAPTLGALLSLPGANAPLAPTSAVAIVLGDVKRDRQMDALMGAPDDEAFGKLGAGTLHLYDFSPGGFLAHVHHVLRRDPPREGDALGN